MPGCCCTDLQSGLARQKFTRKKFGANLALHSGITISTVKRHRASSLCVERSSLCLQASGGGTMGIRVNYTTMLIWGVCGQREHLPVPALFFFRSHLIAAPPADESEEELLLPPNQRRTSTGWKRKKVSGLAETQWIAREFYAI